MKKLLTLLVMAGFLFGFVACGSQSSEGSESEATEMVEEATEETEEAAEEVVEEAEEATEDMEEAAEEVEAEMDSASMEE